MKKEKNTAIYEYDKKNIRFIADSCIDFTYLHCHLLALYVSLVCQRIK